MSSPVEQYRRQLYAALQAVPEAQIMRAAEVLLEAHRRRSAIFVLCPPEDGGTVGHFVHELAGGIGNGPFAFRLVRLYGSPGEIVAWQNDWACEEIYSEQMRGVIRPGDVVTAISHRGQAPGMVRALQAARRSGARTIVLAGPEGSQLEEQADICLRVEAGRAEQVEDVELMLEHMLCVTLRWLLSHEVPSACEAGPGDPQPRARSDGR